MCYFAMLISVKFEWIDEGETRRVRSHANTWMFLNDFNDAAIQWMYGTVKDWGFLKGSRMFWAKQMFQRSLLGIWTEIQ